MISRKKCKHLFYKVPISTVDVQVPIPFRCPLLAPQWLGECHWSYERIGKIKYKNLHTYLHVIRIQLLNLETRVAATITTATTPNLEKASSRQVSGLVMIPLSLSTCSIVFCKLPELSITWSARSRFASKGSWELMRAWAWLRVLLSRLVSRVSCVARSTHTTTTTWVRRSILVSNRSGMSIITTGVPRIQCFATS